MGGIGCGGVEISTDILVSENFIFIRIFVSLILEFLSEIWKNVPHLMYSMFTGYHLLRCLRIARDYAMGTT